ALGKPSRSPAAVTNTCFNRVRGRTFCTTCAKFSSTRMAVAPESMSWCSSSGAVYSGLVLTTISPLRSAANIAIGYCSTLGNTFALGESRGLLQVGREIPGEPVDIAERQRATHLHVRHRIRKPRAAVVNQSCQCGQLSDVDVRGHAFRVGLQPDSVHFRPLND